VILLLLFSFLVLAVEKSVNITILNRDIDNYLNVVVGVIVVLLALLLIIYLRRREV